MLQETLTLATAEHKIETPHIQLWMEDEILYCKYAQNLHMNLNVAKFCVEARIFFSKGKSFPLLIDMRGIQSTTSEARQYMATVGATLVTAAALVTGSAFNNALGNVFLKINKPPIPIKLFTDQEKARLWLSKFD